MKLFLFLITFTTIQSISYGQDLLKVDFSKIKGGYVVVADNNEPVPVSVEVNLDLKNMRSTKGNNKIFVIPGNASKHEITRLKIIDPTRNSNFHINTLSGLGDHTQTNYDYEYPYSLPYDTGDTYKVMQGYNGHLSHLHQHALDFNIPMGGRILSARGGIVVKVEDRNSKSCGQPRCNKFNNYIRVYHDDGTFAEYTHIQRGSAKVRKGDRIKQGQHIASCGNVGWATGAHLHFEVFLLNMNKKKTVPTKFKISENEPLQELVEKQSYHKGY